jgi:hypothetical protein
VGVGKEERLGESTAGETSNTFDVDHDHDHVFFVSDVITYLSSDQSA